MVRGKPKNPKVIYDVGKLVSRTLNEAHPYEDRN